MERLTWAAKRVRKARLAAEQTVTGTQTLEEAWATSDELPLALVPGVAQARSSALLKQRQAAAAGHRHARAAAAILATEDEADVARTRKAATAAAAATRQAAVKATAAATTEAALARRGHAANALGRQQERATELLTAEKELGAAKDALLAAEEEAVAAAQQRCAYGYLDLTGQLLLRTHGAEVGLAVARERLEKARAAAALATNSGWSVTTTTRQLAAARALRGGYLPREVRARERVGDRSTTWQQAESAQTKKRRAERAEQELRRETDAALKVERQRMSAADAAAIHLNRYWRRATNRKAKREATEAHQTRLTAERSVLRDKEQRRLEAMAVAEAREQRQRKGHGTGAGRRCDGPAAGALKAFMAATPRAKALREAARAAALPRRAPSREEVRDRLGGTVTWFDGRAANEKGFVQSLLLEDEVAEAWAEEGTDGDEAAGSATCSEWSDGGGGAGECMGGATASSHEW